MRKPRIIYIGNYADKRNIDFLEAFIEKFSDNYEISVTGYNLGLLDHNETVTENCSIVYMNSSRHVLDKNTAEYVVITTPAPRFIREKNNQKIIYIISEFDPNQFAGCIGDIAQIITDNEEVYQSVKKTFRHIIADYYDEKRSFSDVLDAMIIDPDRKEKAVDYMLVSANEEGGLLKDRFGVGRYFKDIIGKAYNGFIALTIKGAAEGVPSNIAFNESARTKNLLQEFDGILIFDSEAINGYFTTFVNDKDISVKTDKIVMLEDLQLVPVENAVRQKDPLWTEKSSSNYVRYRAAMDRLYTLRDLKDILVSIIICRYNTPFDLLERAINSALNTGHENVEVIVVDDGSKDNLEKELLNKINDTRLKYFYKENEGPGLSRNFGVDRASGKYVFYLDSDDTIFENGLCCLIAHAELFELDLVIGKRILCDEKGIPRSESLRHLSGDVFTCYYNDCGSHRVLDDVMVNNFLIKRQALLDKGIRFSRGLYEDVEYTAIIYSKIKEYHYLNVPIHNWYQYGTNTSISSSVNIRNLKERIEKEESAWKYFTEQMKKGRIGNILLSDFNMYLNSFYVFNEDDRLVAWKLIRDFLADKKEYFNVYAYPEKIKELTRSFLYDNYDYFKYVIDRYYMAETDSEGFDDFIVFTHYHLYVACLYAIRSKRKCRLFICQSYVAFDTNIIYKIRQTGVFNSVKPFVYGATVGSLFRELEKRPGEEALIIPNSLYSYFKEIFHVCNTLLDTMYIFSDTLPYWYYIEREFENVVKLEDAYNSFDREVKTHEMTGIWAGIQEFEGSVYPKMFFRSDKIKKIIVSSMPEGIPEYYYRKIEVLDTKSLEKEYYDEIKNVMLTIYEVDPVLFTEDTTLLLTQPLALFGYCSEKEQRKLMAKMCEPYKGSPLLIKPHPADKMDYHYLGGIIIPRSVPIEVYNYLDVKIERAITFGSSAIETIEIAKEKKAYFKLHDFDFEEVVTAIKQMVKPEPPKKKS